MNGHNCDIGVPNSPQALRLALRERLRVIEQHMDAEHWQRDLSATEMYADTAATTATKAKFNSVEVLSLPDSGSPRVSWGILRPDYALDGIWRVRFWYSHSATEQAAVCTLEARAIDPGSTTLGATGGLSASITFPATGLANRIEKLDVDDVGLLATPGRELLEWRMTRVTADGKDGTATLYIRRVQCYYTPVRQEI